MPRRFSTPADLLRAYASHRHTRDRLKQLTEQADDEQRALDHEMAELIRHLPYGIYYQDVVYRLVGYNAKGPDILVTPAPVASYDLDTWADVEEYGEPKPTDDAPIGPGPDAPSYTVPSNADVCPPDESLTMAGIEVRDDDGDDF